MLMDEMSVLDYQKQNMNYIGDYIKFTDQKAGISLTVCLALLAFYGALLKKMGLHHVNIWIVGFFIGLLLILAAVYLLIWKVIWPRYVKGDQNYLSWSGIATFDNSNDYAKRMLQINATNLARDLCKQNYELAKVCVHKNDNLRLAFIFLSSGAVLSTLIWFFAMS